MTPPVRYRVASPSGDFPIDPAKLGYFLEGDPLRTTYRTYFDAITRFLAREGFRPLLNAVGESLGFDIDLGAIDEIIVRAEKHGALSHPASIECVLGDARAKFGLHVAMTPTGKDSLQREFSALTTLHSRFGLPYVPMPYCVAEVNSIGFLLEEWFDDYHEFHVSGTEDGGYRVKLWEYGIGDRYLTGGDSFEIYRQAARILTLYYDPRDFRVIYPWHHAAGDFVARIQEENSPIAFPSPQGFGDTRDGKKETSVVSPVGGEGHTKKTIDVKLTTVRGYEPFISLDGEEMVSPVLALFYFLLHLSVQMRIDRVDGVGESVWAPDYCVDAAVTGFLEGLTMKRDFVESCGSREAFLRLLRSFTREEIGETFVPVAEQFEQTRDYPLIQEHLPAHAERLYLTLQNSP